MTNVAFKLSSSYSIFEVGSRVYDGRSFQVTYFFRKLLFI